MNASRKYKLIWVCCSFAGFALVLALVLFAINQQANYYYNPIDINQTNISPNQKIRVGGLVVKKSVIRDSNNPLLIHFQITDNKAIINVTYQGILPDLFKENAGVTVEGYWKNNQLTAETVLAKHDENYMPPPVQKSLANTDTN